MPPEKPLPTPRRIASALEFEIEKHANGKTKRLSFRLGTSLGLLLLLAFARALGLDLPLFLGLVLKLMGR